MRMVLLALRNLAPQHPPHAASPSLGDRVRPDDDRTSSINLQTGSYDAMIGVGVVGARRPRRGPGRRLPEGAGQRPRRHRRRRGRTRRLAEPRSRTRPIAPRLMLGGPAHVDHVARSGSALSGIDGAAEAKVQDIDEQVASRAPGSTATGAGSSLGSDLADVARRRARRQGRATWASTAAPRRSTSRLFRVKGIFRTGSAELDGFGAFADLAGGPGGVRPAGRREPGHGPPRRPAATSTSPPAQAAGAARRAGRSSRSASWPAALPEHVRRSSRSTRSRTTSCSVILGRDRRDGRAEHRADERARADPGVRGACSRSACSRAGCRG